MQSIKIAHTNLETDLSLISQNDLHDDWCSNILMHMCEFMCIKQIALEIQRSSWRLITACLMKRARCELSSLTYFTSASSWGPQRFNLLQETSCPCTTTPLPSLPSLLIQRWNTILCVLWALIKKRKGTPAVAILCIMHSSWSVYVISECDILRKAMTFTKYSLFKMHNYMSWRHHDVVTLDYIYIYICMVIMLFSIIAQSIAVEIHKNVLKKPQN